VLEIIEQLNQTEDLSEASVKVALVGLFRDLRGITQATTTKRTYNLLFDAVFPACFELLKRATEFNYNDPHVMTALLKFLMVRLPFSPLPSLCSLAVDFTLSCCRGNLYFTLSPHIVLYYFIFCCVLFCCLLAGVCVQQGRARGL
jgi:hypothetical protein